MLLTAVKQQWTAYGACRYPVVAAKILVDARESTRALAKYIEELEARVLAK